MIKIHTIIISWSTNGKTVDFQEDMILLRLIYMFFYLCGYLIYSLPTLLKMKKVAIKNKAENDSLIHTLPKNWARGFLKHSGCKVSVKGTENIPDGPVLFVANHEGNFDVPVLIGYIPKPFGFISKIEVKKLPIISGWMETMGCVFIDRKDRRSSVQSIRDGIQKLKDGHSILVFPEGTRSKGGEMAKFKAGSLRMAKDSKVPIVPVMIHGTANIFEKNNNRIRPGHITLEVLPAIYSEKYDEEGMAVIADQIQESINAKRVNLLKGA